MSWIVVLMRFEFGDRRSADPPAHGRSVGCVAGRRRDGGEDVRWPVRRTPAETATVRHRDSRGRRALDREDQDALCMRPQWLECYRLRAYTWLMLASYGLIN